MTELVQILRDKRDLPDKGLVELLETDNQSLVEELKECARATAIESFGKEVFLRGLIEWSNVCRNDCLYCGIRCSNANIQRYTLTREQILSCCELAYSSGIRTFVLQGGENPSSAQNLVPVVAEIHASWPDCAITLSLGELPFDLYEKLRIAGADRYLLRHETANPVHYAMLHPITMGQGTRLKCLYQLRELCYQTGMGMMVGSPFQKTEYLVEDIRLIQMFRPEMIGIGPFIPHKDTKFADFPAGSAELTLRLYSILRLMLPKANIPSTTALSSVLPGGRIKGILAGANVIMPNFTPPQYRDAYSLYEGKAMDPLEEVQKELSAEGYFTRPNRGDYNN